MHEVLAMGRPSQGRTESLDVKLTPEEMAHCRSCASAMGLSLSAWVRLVLCAAARASERSV